MIIKESMMLGDAEFSLETGLLAKQAHGSIVARYGDTMVLAACVGSEESKPGQDFFPLTVEYRENYFAAGKFPGGYIKREGRMTLKETLTSRLIDRPLRPMFAEGYLGDTTLNASVISYDNTNDADVVGMVAAAASAYLSPLPLHDAIAAVRVGYVDGKLIVNPTVDQRKDSTLDLIVAGTKTSITMVEAGAKFVSEELVVDALEFAQQNIAKIVDLIEKMAKKMKIEKWEVTKPEIDTTFYKAMEKKIGKKLITALTTKGKKKGEVALSDLKKEWVASFEDEEEQAKAATYFSILKERSFRDYTLNQKKRTDGRAFDEVRPISIHVGYLPKAHGSSVFTRGETQALVSLTLGTSSDAQMVDGLAGEQKQTFMLHYNFPGFSVGEPKPSRGPGRRELGHGALAERALAPVVPFNDKFPYTVRLVSDILESNGSSSMASVCGGSLAMLDAGVPLVKPVAGVAMGLVMEGDNYAVLTDIQGAEDHYGDMDFKVAGSEDGITALQMDIKVKGLTREIMAKALDQARAGRLHILGKMNEAISQPRKDLADHAPQIETIMIPVDKIREVIGPGGKVIRSIVEKSGAKIDIEDSGKCVIFGTDTKSCQTALQMVQDLIAVPEEGKTYLGKITRITDFGAFVEIIPGTEGLLHISEIANYRVRAVTDELQEGQEVMVKVLALEKNGRIKLSRKALLEG
ncbi:MAG: polyribonucleotide nucleotidyltransferase [Acidobacteria bacterium]|nr:polyribonucleotide nucleotidyltransferase [Acidobacteriota bacterium]